MDNFQAKPVEDLRNVTVASARSIAEALSNLRFNPSKAVLVPEVLDSFHWKALETHSFGRRRLTELQTSFRKYAGSQVRNFRFDDFMRFYRTGSRVEFEAGYFEHREILEVFALAALAGFSPALETIEALENIIWAVCDEYSWCLPAHMPLNPSQEEREHHRSVDLFASETAFTLAEILNLLGDRLSPELVARARSELEERVLDSYLSYSRSFSWEGVNHNWAAVCAGSIGGAALYVVKDSVKLRAIISRLAPSLDSYLSGFADDGCCTEGMGYWTYGFGHFLTFADLVRRYDPAIDLLVLPSIAEKVRAISLFPQRARLVSASVIGFSDAFSPYRFAPGFLSLVHNRFPEAELQDWRYAEDFDTKVHRRWSQHLRDFLWFDPGFPENAEGLASGPGTVRDLHQIKYHFFQQAQWLVVRTKPVGDIAEGRKATVIARAFAAKGGHNGEPHNHNDVGSFMLVADGENLLDDFGAGLYEKGYFNQDRYSYFVATSASHSVPIIDDEGQKPGPEFRARKVVCDTPGLPPAADDQIGFESITFEMDMAAAYGLDYLQKLIRRFVLDAGLTQLTLSDEYHFKSSELSGHREIRERFVSYFEPRVLDDSAVAINATLSRAIIKAKTKPQRIELNERDFMGFGNIQRKARMIDFVYFVPLTDTKFEINFELKIES